MKTLKSLLSLAASWTRSKLRRVVTLEEGTIDRAASAGWVSGNSRSFYSLAASSTHSKLRWVATLEEGTMDRAASAGWVSGTLIFGVHLGLVSTRRIIVALKDVALLQYGAYRSN